MLPEPDERFKQPVAEFMASPLDTPYNSTQFFVKWIMGGNVHRPDQPWESYKYNHCCPVNALVTIDN
jgi:hypothetical protein